MNIKQLRLQLDMYETLLDNGFNHKEVCEQFPNLTQLFDNNNKDKHVSKQTYKPTYKPKNVLYKKNNEGLSQYRAHHIVMQSAMRDIYSETRVPVNFRQLKERLDNRPNDGRSYKCADTTTKVYLSTYNNQLWQRQQEGFYIPL